MTDYIELLREKVQEIQLGVNSTVWGEAEGNIKKDMLALCSEMRIALDTLNDDLNKDVLIIHKKLICDSMNMEDIMYNRGRLNQIKKLIK